MDFGMLSRIESKPHNTSSKASVFALKLPFNSRFMFCFATCLKYLKYLQINDIPLLILKAFLCACPIGNWLPLSILFIGGLVTAHLEAVY